MRAAAAPPPGLLDCDVPLARRYDVALLDLDGVVYLGPDAVAGAPEALRRARAVRMRLAFVTNNAARPPEVVAAHLRDLGVAADAAEVTTSAQAAARYLAERLAPGDAVLVIGTTGLDQALGERGLTPVHRDGPEVVAVVQGFSPDLTWRQLAEGAVAINRGLPWIATNLDPTVPSPRGRLPGTGSMVAALRHATGREPTAVTGKPDPTMHRESVERSGARHPLVVGDRLDTDIEGANAASCASLLVLSGVTGPAELLAAPAGRRPNYVAPDVSGLLEPHRAPAAAGPGFRCGPWQAAPDGARGRLSRAPAGTSPRDPANAGAPGSRERMDALRAMCALAWRAGDEAAGTDGPPTPGRALAWRPGDEAADAVLASLGLGRSPGP